MTRFTEIAFTGAVKKIQSLTGSRAEMQRVADTANTGEHLSKELQTFVAQCNFVTIASANGEGQPHIQHRYDDRGAIRVINDTTLMIAGHPENRQFITHGNVKENPKVMLHLVDYYQRRHLKIWGKAYITFDANLSTLVDHPHQDQPYPMIVVKIQAWDGDCAEHTPRLYSEHAIRTLEGRIDQLQAVANGIGHASTL